MRPLRFRNILVATDLGEAQLPALRTAAELARLGEASLYVFHAAPPADARPPEAALTAHIRAAGIEPRMISGASVAYGTPAEAIAEEARRVDADVIVLGPHRKDSPAGLGSTADKLLRVTDTPCLILPHGLTLPLVSVLAPVELSETAPDVLATALTWTSALRQRKRGSGEATRLVVLNITSDETEAETGGAAKALERKVAALREAYADSAGVDVQQSVKYGIDPAAMIFDLADAGKFDLLILGTRDKSSSDAALGSVSSSVMRRSDRPVLLVPHWKRALS